jgi:hypothetical protein
MNSDEKEENQLSFIPNTSEPLDEDEKVYIHILLIILFF